MTTQDRLTETIIVKPPARAPEGPALKLTLPGKPGKKRIWAALGVVLVSVASFLYFHGPNEPKYLTVPVGRGDVDSLVSATGNTNAVVTVQVGSQVSGNIIALYADFNTKVKQGQLVARIDPAIFQAKVDQAEANMDSAKAAVVTAGATVKKSESDLANAQANVATQKANLLHAQSATADAKTKYDRRVDLFRSGIIAQEEFDTAKATFDQAVASQDAAHAQVNAAQSLVESARAQRDVSQTQLASTEAVVKQDAAALAQAQLDLDHTRILAPVDGTVVSRNMDVGQTVAASFQAPTIFLIARDLTKMQVDTNVDESDVGRVRLGQQANFTVDAYPGRIFPGVVTQIRKAPINVQNVITYDVVVQVSNEDLNLFPGMTANVKILTDRAVNTLRIPNAALRFHPVPAPSRAGAGPSPSQTIYVLDQQGRPKPLRVTLGISDGNYTTVTGGDLKDGEQVVEGTASREGETKTPAGSSPRRLRF